jgi:hypothetical protein
MKKKETPKPGNDNKSNQPNTEPEGYPLYPPQDDIYSRLQKEDDIDPEDPSRLKEFDPLDDVVGEEILDVDEEIIHTDLDVPGAELDDDQEEIGNEDEENNYYSIGGDNHHDLEEDREEELDI